MGGWQPGKVVKAVEELVDEHITGSFTLSIARQPKLPPGQELSREELQKLDYLPLGTQAPLDLKKLTRLWNALANSALHVQVPKVRTDQLSIHGDPSRITEKVQQCLTEFGKISDGTLLVSGLGPEVSVACEGCGYPIKRRIARLSDKQSVSCVNPDCAESYIVEKTGENDFTFERRLVVFNCNDCGTTNNLPWRQVEKMRVFDVTNVACSTCSVPYKIGARLEFSKA